MISIIVPVYKAEKFISRCVDSVIAQTYQDWELLLVDDGSPDQSGVICDNYSRNDQRIKVFHKQNGGVSSARNLGIENAQGEWITFLDADDYILTDFLSHLADKIQPGIDLIISGSKRFGDSSLDNSIPCDCEYDSNLLIINKINVKQEDYVFHGTCSYPWGKLLRTSVVKQHHLCFDTSMKVSEDTCFMLKYLNRIDKVLFVKGGDYMYYTSSGSKTYMQMSLDEYKTHTEGLKRTLEEINIGKKANIIDSNFSIKLQQLYFTAFLNGLSLLNYNLFNEQWKKFKSYNTFDINMLLLSMSRKRKMLYSFTIKLPALFFLILKAEKYLS